VAGTNSIESI